MSLERASERFSAERIVVLLRQIEVLMSQGKTAPTACREAGISQQRRFSAGFRCGNCCGRQLRNATLRQRKGHKPPTATGHRSALPCVSFRQPKTLSSDQVLSVQPFVGTTAAIIAKGALGTPIIHIRGNPHNRFRRLQPLDASMRKAAALLALRQSHIGPKIGEHRGRREERKLAMIIWHMLQLPVNPLRRFGLIFFVAQRLLIGTWLTLTQYDFAA
jgi:hypothetical protein